MSKRFETALFVTSSLLAILAVGSILVLDIPSFLGWWKFTRPPVTVESARGRTTTFIVESVYIRPSLVILQLVLVAAWCFVARERILRQNADRG